MGPVHDRGPGPPPDASSAPSRACATGSRSATSTRSSTTCATTRPRTATRVGMMGDDGEKFGAWPTTWEHCWGEGRWVERFFEALEANADWLTTTTPSAWLARPPRRSAGSTSRPGSYAEMGEWALPADESLVFADVLHRGAGGATDPRRAGCAARSGATSRSSTARSTTSTSRCCGRRRRSRRCRAGPGREPRRRPPLPGPVERLLLARPVRRHLHQPHAPRDVRAPDRRRGPRRRPRPGRCDAAELARPRHGRRRRGPPGRRPARSSRSTSTRAPASAAGTSGPSATRSPRSCAAGPRRTTRPCAPRGRARRSATRRGRRRCDARRPRSTTSSGRRSRASPTGSHYDALRAPLRPRPVPAERTPRRRTGRPPGRRARRRASTAPFDRRRARRRAGWSPTRGATVAGDGRTVRVTKTLRARRRPARPDARRSRSTSSTVGGAADRARLGHRVDADDARRRRQPGGLVGGRRARGRRTTVRRSATGVDDARPGQRLRRRARSRRPCRAAADAWWAPVETISNSEDGFERVYQGSGAAPVVAARPGAPAARWSVRVTQRGRHDRRDRATERVSRPRSSSTATSISRRGSTRSTGLVPPDPTAAPARDWNSADRGRLLPAQRRARQPTGAMSWDLGPTLAGWLRDAATRSPTRASSTATAGVNGLAQPLPPHHPAARLGGRPADRDPLGPARLRAPVRAPARPGCGCPRPRSTSRRCRLAGRRGRPAHHPRARGRSHGDLDTRRPYRVDLGDGRSIVVVALRRRPLDARSRSSRRRRRDADRFARERIRPAHGRRLARRRRRRRRSSSSPRTASCTAITRRSASCSSPAWSATTDLGYDVATRSTVARARMRAGAAARPTLRRAHLVELPSRRGALVDVAATASATASWKAGRCGPRSTGWPTAIDSETETSRPGPARVARPVGGARRLRRCRDRRDDAGRVRGAAGSARTPSGTAAARVPDVMAAQRWRLAMFAELRLVLGDRPPETGS